MHRFSPLASVPLVLKRVPCLYPLFSDFEKESDEHPGSRFPGAKECRFFFLFPLTGGPPPSPFALSPRNGGRRVPSFPSFSVKSSLGAMFFDLLLGSEAFFSLSSHAELEFPVPLLSGEETSPHCSSFSLGFFYRKAEEPEFSWAPLC